MTQEIHKICIIGGGTAGWMAAGYCEKFLPDAEISLIESPSIPVVGVGESTLPQIKAFFDEIGINQDTWIKECDAIIKVGNSKSNWNHPDNPEDYLDFTFWFNDEAVFDDWVKDYKTGSKTKHQINDDLYYNVEKDELSYSYHLTAEKIPLVIKKHCKRINHIEKEIDELPEGYDYYLICTGTSKKFVPNTELEDISKYHKVNSAWVCSLAHPENYKIDSFTRSTAKPYGWQFSIDTVNKTGLGYVFSDEYRSVEDAKQDFLEYIRSTGRKFYKNSQPKLIKWQPGWLKEGWQTTDKGEIVALGLANGMIDPLESNALFMIQYTVTAFVRSINRKSAKETYNRAIKKLWSLNSTFIRQYYIFAKRNDTTFWEYYKTIDKDEHQRLLWESYKQMGNKYYNLYPDALWANVGLYFDEFKYYEAKK